MEFDLDNKYNAGDIETAINNLSNEGHIYPTIENHFQYTGCVDDAVLQVIKTLGGKFIRYVFINCHWWWLLFMYFNKSF